MLWLEREELTDCAMQNKYDALGGTTAALSLVSHSSKVVRLSAIRLLLALLQGCNRSVQRTIAGYFASPTRQESVFQCIKGILHGAFSALRDIKRSMKAQKTQGHLPLLSRKASIVVSVREVGETFRKSRSEEESLDDADGIGRQSAVMFALVLLQFMCEGQYTPLQDLVGQHSSPHGGGDLLKLMIDLFCTAQLLLSDALSACNSNSHHLLGLCVQLVETISESCQGPHRQNLEQLLFPPSLCSLPPSC
jgi:hypothetical protein